MSMIGHNGAPQEGYVLIFRKLLSHPVVGMMQPVKSANPKKPSASRLEAWLDLLMMAVYDDQTLTMNGFKFELERGDQVCATSFLSKRWNWSEKTVRGFLERLEKHEMLQRKGRPKGQANGKRPNHISICNYSQYQDGGQYDQFEKGKQEGKQEGKQKGQEESELTRCNKTINMFDDTPQGPREGQQKGQAKGRQYKTNNKPNKKDNINIIQKDKKSDLQIALDEYNQLADRAGLPKAKVLNKDRTKKLTARLDEHGLDGWRQALGMIEGSSFLCGETTDWKANFDFLIQPSSFVKVIEGQYGNGRARKPKLDPKRAEELRKKYAAPPPIIREDAI